MSSKEGHNMFDYKGYKELQDVLSKKAQFVPMGGDPAAGGMPPGDPAAGGMPPGDPAAMGGAMPPDAGGMPPVDPAAMGGDPMAGGMPPVDPAMMGGAMPPGADPMAGMPDPAAGDVSPSGEPYMKITPTQLSKLFKQFAEVFKSVLGIQQPAGAAPAAPAAPQQDPNLAAKVTEVDAKLNALINQIGG
jgi:hypothetical protein